MRSGRFHPLDRHPERCTAGPVLDVDGLQVGQQCRPPVPRCLGARFDDVDPSERRQGDAGDSGQSDLGRERPVLSLDVVEHLLGVVHQIELVHRYDDMFDTQQGHQKAVAACLGEHSLPGVDEDDSGVGRRCTGHHVPGVLLVSRGIGHDELLLLGGKEPVRHVDGDSLLPLGSQAVHQEGEIEITTLGSHLSRVHLQSGQVIVEHEMGLVQQPPDECALTVVNAPAGDESEQLFVLMDLQIGIDVGGDERLLGHGHQKYPSCFFFSIEPDTSKSMTRPSRSDVVASSISWMTSGTVAAVLSTAPVRG